MHEILGKFKRPDRRDAISKDLNVWTRITQEKRHSWWKYHYSTSISLSETKGINLGTFWYRPSCPPNLTNVSHQVHGSFLNVGLLTALSNTPFNQQSDLDVARGINAKQILERHWDTWVTEEDWVWISERGVNTVRIPVSSLLICLLNAIWSVPFYLNFHRLAIIISAESILLFYMVQISNRFRRCTQARGPRLSEQLKQLIVMG